MRKLMTLKKNIAIILFITPFIYCVKPATANPCEPSPISQQEMFACSFFMYNQADTELNRVWKNLSESTRNQLRQEQRDWIKYRDEKCEQETLENFDKNSINYRLTFPTCQAEKTKQRTEYLRQFL